jgi:PAS domain S-box-containing protein
LEFAIVLSGVGVTLGLLAFSNHSVSTFERDLPLVGITLEIQSHISESQQTTAEVLAGDVDADRQQIFETLDHATEDCRTLVVGGDTRLGSVAPLSEAADRRSAAALCSGIPELASLTRRLLQEPVARGEGTEFDERYDLAVTQLAERTEALSVALRQDVADDASALDRLGNALAWSVLLLAAVIAVLANWHRRTLAAKTGELIRLGVIVNASSDGILSMTPEGTVTAWNRGAENLYGWRAEEIVGRDVGVLVPPSRREEEDTLLARARRGEEVKTETERVRKDGSLVPVALTVSPILEGEVVTGIASIQQDITERLAKDVQLVVAREQALEASRQKTEFLSTMSHEIRTPMNGVIGLTGLLLQSDLDEQQRQHAQGVRSAGESLMTLINEILDFSKIEAGKLELETLDFNLVQVVEEAAELVATQAQRKGLELLAYCSPELPLGLRGDPTRLRQVLLNLASNAIKFTAEGEVVIRAQVEDLDATDVVVRFEVTDTGVGISEADQERLFEPFVQADSSTTRQYGGTGLGLAISRRLVTAMGGALGVDSEAGRGSTFWFTLPLGLAIDETVARPVSTGGLAGVRVLVVDDNHTNRLILTEQLGAWGMRLGVAEDGESALRCLQEAAIGDDPYVLALLDMCMPGMDGLQLATRISGNSALPSTALVLLTSAQELRSEEARQAGISAQLTKPIHMSRLQGALHDSLGLVRPDPNTVAPPLSQPRAPGSRGHLLVAEDNYVNQLVATGMLERLGYTTEVASNGIEAVAAFDRTSFSAVLMDCQMPEMDGYAATETVLAQDIPEPCLKTSRSDVASHPGLSLGRVPASGDDTEPIADRLRGGREPTRPRCRRHLRRL